MKNDLVPAPQPEGVNPYASRIPSLRAALLNAVTADDIYDIVKLQVFLAKKGDTFATREILDRTLGRSIAMDTLMRIEALEAELFKLRNDK